MPTLTPEQQELQDLSRQFITGELAFDHPFYKLRTGQKIDPNDPEAVRISNLLSTVQIPDITPIGGTPPQKVLSGNRGTGAQ